MAHIKSGQMYQALLKRVDELLIMTSDNDSMEDSRMLELDIISDLIAEYEDIHYPIGKEEQAHIG
ncbi:MAG: XRE family transcriptional regulator [Bacteroidales bacterium]|nr:XRE family transcriptional regulator [Bacteroidales bacterium]MBR0177679.1 XRE family transcriptional regulator [Bacteroidales bacterium]